MCWGFCIGYLIPNTLVSLCIYCVFVCIYSEFYLTLYIVVERSLGTLYIVVGCSWTQTFLALARAPLYLLTKDRFSKLCEENYKLREGIDERIGKYPWGYSEPALQIRGIGVSLTEIGSNNCCGRFIPFPEQPRSDGLPRTWHHKTASALYKSSKLPGFFYSVRSHPHMSPYVSSSTAVF